MWAIHYRRHGNLRDGAVADDIPSLADADAFGICLVTPDGVTHEVGDTRGAFTIQSISKPFVFGLALEDLGPEAVRAKIGVEPSGEAFNSIKSLAAAIRERQGAQ